LVPATDELIAELARYRRAHGLPPTPQPGETRPLVLPVIGRQNDEKALSRGALHLMLEPLLLNPRQPGSTCAIRLPIICKRLSRFLAHS